MWFLYEPRREKTGFYYAKTKAVTARLISTFVFATQIVQFLLYLYPKCQDSSFLLWMYRPVCVGPGRKPGRPVFSRRCPYWDDLIFSPLNERRNKIYWKSSMACDINSQFTFKPFEQCFTHQNQNSDSLKCF